MTVSTSEAIAELSAPTGDPEEDAVRAALIDNIQRGYFTTAGRGEDGELRFRLTDAGKRRVEGLIEE